MNNTTATENTIAELRELLADYEFAYEMNRDNRALLHLIAETGREINDLIASL